MPQKRRVEVFPAGCPLCDETVRLAEKLSRPSCTVTVYKLNESGMDKARQYGVTSVPTVVVDGKIAECCKWGQPTKAKLRKAGIGVPLQAG